jgi:hypothetical protein
MSASRSFPEPMSMIPPHSAALYLWPTVAQATSQNEGGNTNVGETTTLWCVPHLDTEGLNTKPRHRRD